MSEIKQIATALVKAQSEMSNPKKGSSNPFFKSKYADLNSIREAVLPILNSNGISVLQPTVNIDGKNFVKTILLHESGEMLESFTEILFSKINDAQAQGSGISYARRYGLQSFVCVGADDDDGQKAVQQPKANTELPWLNVLDKDKNQTREWARIVALKLENNPISIDVLKTKFKISNEVLEKINQLYSTHESKQ